MSKTSRTPYKKNNVKETCERCGKKKNDDDDDGGGDDGGGDQV